jgi:CheY-like chemotaxis protein
METHSSPGKGTLVRLWVPLSAAVSEKSKIIDKIDSFAKPALSRLNTGEDLRVLLVDDHEIFREGLTSILEEVDGIKVVGEASDGAQAIEMARSLHPDVILMDINLPVMNGIEATRKITAKMPDIRIIGLSVNSEDDMADSMIAAGAAAYVTKGGPSKELFAALLGETNH